MALKEAVVLPKKFPELFSGKRKPWKGILLFGPPGTGKTYLAKAVATESQAHLISVSSSDIMNKYQGESEGNVKKLFDDARAKKNCIIFIDEIDAFASKSVVYRLVLTEFLVQMDGAGKGEKDIFVLAATNVPWDLDEAMLRRLERRVYIPLPETEGRAHMFRLHVGDTLHSLNDSDFDSLAEMSEGYSGSDIQTVTREALMAPLRASSKATHFRSVLLNGREKFVACSANEVGAKRMNLMDVPGDKLALAPVAMGDFEVALKSVHPSVGLENLAKFEQFAAASTRPVDTVSAEMQGALSSAVVTEKPDVKWSEVAGLAEAKRSLQEAVILPKRFPHLFTGKRTAWKSILLYGPPGTGKTYLAKAVATESDAAFFSVSSSDLLNKWIGQSEKMVKELFSLARSKGNSIIFIDEIDALISARGDDDEGHSRRVKTEFLVNMDGVGKNADGVLVLAATNTPWDLDDALLRRMERRVYIPLPDMEGREQLLRLHLGDTPHNMSGLDFAEVARILVGYSGSDLKTVTRDAIMEPLRASTSASYFRTTMVNGKAMLVACAHWGEPGARRMRFDEVSPEQLYLPDVEKVHFLSAVARCKPSVSLSVVSRFEKWTSEKGLDGQ
jgi:vacuolar protein-sorting-associated protein 4